MKHSNTRHSMRRYRRSMWRRRRSMRRCRRTMRRCRRSMRRRERSMRPIVEETLTSGKYVSLFLISILYIYIYIKITKIMWRPTYFLKKYTKTGTQRKFRKWWEQMHRICCYSSSDNINCHSIQAARKKYANNIKHALDFYYYHHFCMATFKS